MDFARLAVPTVAKNLVALLGGDGFGVRDAAITKIGKSRSLFNNTTLFLAKLVLLAVGGVPNVVDAEVGDGHENVEPGRPCIIGGVVPCDVECAVAVG